MISWAQQPKLSFPGSRSSGKGPLLSLLFGHTAHRGSAPHLGRCECQGLPRASSLLSLLLCRAAHSSALVKNKKNELAKKKQNQQKLQALLQKGVIKKAVQLEQSPAPTEKPKKTKDDSINNGPPQAQQPQAKPPQKAENDLYNFVEPLPPSSSTVAKADAAIIENLEAIYNISSNKKLNIKERTKLILKEKAKLKLLSFGSKFNVAQYEEQVKQIIQNINFLGKQQKASKQPNNTSFYDEDEDENEEGQDEEADLDQEENYDMDAVREIEKKDKDTKYSLFWKQWMNQIEQNTQVSSPDNKTDTSQLLYHNSEKEASMKDISYWSNTRFPWDETVRAAHSQVFGIEKLRPLQLEAINGLMAGHSVFLSLPTGGGKSLCYLTPAIAAGGMTLVISPLIALIQDQLQKARSVGIPATYISSLMGKRDQKKVLKELEDLSPPKLLFVTPERLSNRQFLRALQLLYDHNMLSKICIDEAHCISEWGHDFRPDYRKLSLFQEKFPRVPLLCLTASATREVRKDILNSLKVKQCLIFNASYNRPNLVYTVRRKHRSVVSDMSDIIKKHHKDQCGLIYCLTTKDCELVAEQLQAAGLPVKFYHGGLPGPKRNQIQAEWMKPNSAVKILCTTVAFGMGIDKHDLRFVIHHTIPQSLEAYYQQCGRAGRDGSMSNCILYYDPLDRQRIQKVTWQEEAQVNSVALREQLLDDIVAYCENVRHCRRKILLNHFGETISESQCNNTCDVCRARVKQQGTKPHTPVPLKTAPPVATSKPLPNIIQAEPQPKKVVEPVKSSSSPSVQTKPSARPTSSVSPAKQPSPTKATSPPTTTPQNVPIQPSTPVVGSSKKKASSPIKATTDGTAPTKGSPKAKKK